MIEVRVYQAAGGQYVVAIGPRVVRADLTLKEAEELRRETLKRIRTEQRDAEREALRQAFGILGQP